jgi:hypothetical protein
MSYTLQQAQALLAGGNIGGGYGSRPDRYDAYNNGIHSASLTETGANLRLDSQDVGAFLRDLEDLETDVKRVEHSALPFASGRIVPIEVQNKPWAQYTTYRQIDSVGHFVMIRSYATDIPLVQSLSEEFTQRIHRFAAAAFYTDDEIYASRHLGQDISAEMITTVQEASEQELNQLIAFGTYGAGEDSGFDGFINHPDILRSFSPINIDSNSDADEILGILDDAATAIVTRTQQVEKPNTLLMPLGQFLFIARARLSNDVNDTILRQFLAETPYIENIFALNELAGAGPNGSDVMMAYRRDPSRIKARIKQPLTWLNWEREGLGFKRIATFKYGGLAVYRPWSIHAIAGI